MYCKLRDEDTFDLISIGEPLGSLWVGHISINDITNGLKERNRNYWILTIAPMHTVWLKDPRVWLLHGIIVRHWYKNAQTSYHASSYINSWLHG